MDWPKVRNFFPEYDRILTHSMLHLCVSEVAQWLACWAHNPKVPGSKPGFAMHPLSSPTAVTPWEACAFKVVRLIRTRRIGKINEDRVMNL